MAGSSNFKIFDENLVNIMDDTAYAASTYRTQGAVSGVAPSNVHNKLYRQTSILSAAIAEVAKNRGEVVSDADFNNLVTALTTAFGTELIDKNMWKANTTYAVGDIVDAPTLSNWAYAECSVAGTTGTSEPTWGTTIGATVTDGGVTWIIRSKRQSLAIGNLIKSIDVGSSINGLPAMDGSLLTGIVSSDTGWVKFSDGTMIQHGTNSIAANSGTLTFPLSFTSISTAIITKDTTAARWASVSNVGVSSISIYGWTGTTAAPVDAFHWLAIGRWKV